jgi:hypothetical protein
MREPLTKKERAQLLRLHDHVRGLVAHLPVIAKWFEQSLRLLRSVANGERTP